MDALAATEPALFIDESGAGEPVILLHSSGLSGRQFRRLASMLVERGFRAIVPDLSGHGRSPALPEPQPFSFRSDVAWLSELLARRGPAHLVGHSYGAFVALQAALAVPDRVRSLALFEPVAFGGVLDPIADAEAREDLARVELPWGASDEERERWLRAFVEYWSGDGAWSGQREEVRAELRRVGWAVREGVRSLVEDRTPASAYRAIGAPVTLLTGERSPLAARTVVRVLGATLANAKVVTLAGAGHMAPLTHADAVNGAIVEALTSSR